MPSKTTPRTDAAIGKLPPVTREALVPFGQSLYLKRRPNGRQSWVLRTRIGGVWRVQQLGDWPTVGLHLARQRAEDARKGLAPAGVDSSVTHALATFKREYIAVRYRTDSNIKESGALLDRALAGVMGRSLSSLRRLDLTATVQRLADRPNAAAKTLALLKQFTGWATARGLLEHDPLAGVTGGRLGLHAYEPRERVLSDDELRALFARDDDDGKLMRFAFLTACRIGEALACKPEQITGDVWTIPETKSGRPHTVPLTADAAALLPLRAVPYGTLYWRMKDVGITWRPHDLRRTAATMMRAAGVPVHDVEAVLNHAPTKLVRVYQRHDPISEKRRALEALAVRVAAIVKW
jgi:integrase